MARNVCRAAIVAVVAFSAQVTAQIADTAVKLTVTLDRSDWRYHVSDTASFSVSLTKSGQPIPGARVTLAVGPERLKPDRTDVLDAPTSVRATMTHPGYLRATASATVDGVRYTALATAAFDPDKLASATPMPDDFMSFWERAISDARRVPLEPVMTRLAERSTPDVEVYHVSFQNHRAGSRIYGMLSVPSKPGKYPAMLVVPGAGVRPYSPSVATARRGVIHLAIGIHGIPVDRDSLLYNDLRFSALAGYQFAGAEDRDTYYYKRVYVGVVRAGDFIFGLPQFDGTNYVVQGGSQGGGLSIVAGVLDLRVRGIAASYPAMADHFGYLNGRAGGWPHIFADTTRLKAKAEKMVTLAYYDAANFAKLLKIPGIYAWGYNDLTVPPTASAVTYNAIPSPKEVVLAPEAGHSRTPAQVERMNAWLLKMLGVGGDR